MSHVFISYNSSDVDFAENLRHRIEQAGIETWMDTDRLGAGVSWRGEIDQAIREACALVVVVTPEATESKYVSYEWAFALGVGVKVIPVLLIPADCHLRLDALQHLDFRDSRIRPWNKLIEQLQEAADADAPHKIRIPRDAPPSVKRVVAALDSSSSIERLGAIETLAQMDHPLVRSVLADAVLHHIQDVRIYAALVLSKFKDAHAIPGLIEAVCEYVETPVGDTIAKELQKIELVARVPDGLPRRFGDLDVHIEGRPTEDWPVRQAAAWALIQISDETAVPLLTKTLLTERLYGRTVAALALGQVAHTGAIPSLLDALHDEEEDMRYVAALALGLIGNASAVPTLLDALSSESGIRTVAAWALGQIGDTSAVPNMCNALNDNYPAVRKAIARALGQIGDATAVSSLVTALHDHDDGVRWAAAKSLGQIGDATAVPSLLTALRDRDDGVRLRATESLAQIGDEAAVPGLIDALGYFHFFHKQYVVSALQRIGTPEALAAAETWRKGGHIPKDDLAGL